MPHPIRSVVPALLLLVIVLPGCRGFGTSEEPGIPRSNMGDRRMMGREPESWTINGPGWRAVGYRLDWQGYPFAGVRTTDSIRQVVPVGDAVIAQESGSTVTVMESSTGANRWSADLASRLTRFVGLLPDPTDPSRLVVASESEVFVVGEQNGNLLARQPLERVVNTQPVVAGNTLVFGTTDGRVVAHDLASGLHDWNFQAAGPIEATPVALDSRVALVSQAGDVVFLDGPTGNLVGRARLFGGVSNTPVTDGTNLYVASLDQSVYAFNSSGAEVWRHRTGAAIRSQPRIVGDNLIVETEAGLSALNRNTGAVKWASKDLHGEVVATHKGNLVAFDGKRVMIVSADRGELISEVDAPGVNEIVTDTFDDGPLYLVTDVNTIVKLQPT